MTNGDASFYEKMELATDPAIWESGGPVEDWTVDYDIRDQDYIDKPVPIWAEMRSQCPIAHTDRLGGSWNPTRFDDVRELAKMTSELSSRQPLVMPPTPDARPESRYTQQVAFAPISADPPIHTWTRRMLLPAFAPRAVEKFSAYTEALCHELIDGFADAGQCDAAVDYAQQIPPRVIAHMLGIDPGMADQFVTWVNAMVGEGLVSPETRMQAWGEFYPFVVGEVQQRVEQPRDDLISELLHTEVDDPDAKVTPNVVVGIVNLLVIAGIDTTWSSIGAALWHFGTNPADLDRLRAEPELLPSAVEESLRYYSPVTMARIAEEDVQIGGHTIHAGDKVLMNFPAANHDPEQFERPDDFVIDRTRNRHIAFGTGIHRCAGSNLARLEMTTALRVWLERIPNFHVTEPTEVVWAGGQVRGPRSIPMTLATAAMITDSSTN